MVSYKLQCNSFLPSSHSALEKKKCTTKFAQRQRMRAGCVTQEAMHSKAVPVSACALIVNVYRGVYSYLEREMQQHSLLSIVGAIEPIKLSVACDSPLSSWRAN
jgi:hypothetical protein